MIVVQRELKRIHADLTKIDKAAFPNGDDPTGMTPQQTDTEARLYTALGALLDAINYCPPDWSVECE